MSNKQRVFGYFCRIRAVFLEFLSIKHRVLGYFCRLRIKTKKEVQNELLSFEVAEREGFEPPVPLGTVVFKTTVIDHSTISPLHWGNRGFLIAGAKVRRKNETTKFFGNYFAKKMHFTCFLSSREHFSAVFLCILTNNV